MEKRRDDHEEKHLHIAFFTMLIALLMLFFQRATIVTLVEAQWRARIFILVNLILLVILYSSIHYTTSSNKHENMNREEEERREKIATKRRHSDVNLTTIDDGEKSEFSYCKKTSRKVVNEVYKNSNEVYNKVGEDVDLLSEEELNKRVEEFIAMFRKHLIVDSKRKNRNVAATRNVRGRSTKHLIS
ncbi:uncharacterized protein LOC104887437 [Beta vulgaris subsp. vulgaris]|uniref:uncharacterized protein LOC104887437 n=1 Tax=Beta vulgaris subsp. vulgaris TaxID=3555 RepID=UPI00053FA24E|nr:uncharacterized protein LOC104887437 [Beta vulgaris subsp. vulgaris]